MANLINFFKNLFAPQAQEPKSSPVFDIDKAISEIRNKSLTGTGRLIYKADHGPFDVRLDRDIVEDYRVTVFVGTERMYSFSIFCDPTDFESLREAYGEIVRFLDGSRDLGQLPDNDLMKGHFFGGGLSN